MFKVASFIIFSIAWAQSAQALKCENVFRLPLKKASHELTVVPAKPAEPPVPVKLSSRLVKEIIEIRDGHLQSPNITYFGGQEIGNYRYDQTSAGDFVSVSIFPKAVIVDRANQNPMLLSMNRSAEQSNQSQVPTVSDYEVMRVDLERSMPGRVVDSAMMDQIMSVARQNPEILAKARSRYDRNVTVPIQLATFGNERYFWFKPDGSENYFPARVLDIHRDQNPIRLSFLVEYVSHPTADGIRRHQVQVLSKSEFKTIDINLPGKSRLDAKDAFIDSLSLDEIATLKKAEELRLKVYGFFEPGRRPGDNDEFIASPLERMNNITHLAMKHDVLERFGSVDDLMTASEKQRPNSNIIDILSRQSPLAIKDRFFKESALNTEFIWTITESGQLKVVPGMQVGNNLKPQYLRLSAGKKVFAGGSFTLERDFSINIRTHGEGFQFDTFHDQHRFAFLDQGPHLSEFITEVFARQMEVKVNTVNNEYLEAWRNGRRGSGPAGQQYWSHFNSKDAFSDFAEAPKASSSRSQTQQKSNQKDVKPWNLESETPMHLSAYVDKIGTHTRDSGSQIEWAHYVLKTNSQMPWAEVKQQYRRLAQRFHQDRNKEARAAETSKAVNDAYRILEEFVK